VSLHKPMKVWLRVPFSILALLAMFATMMPGTVWACPMTGRVDVASRVCLGAMPMASAGMMSGAMPCACFGRKCCKPLSVPASQNDDSGRSHVFAAADHVSFSVVFALQTENATPFVAPRLEAFESSAPGIYLARFADPPPQFWTVYRPLSVAGRAPPVV